ncbi:MAG: cyclic nucleotide-binding domain-containing protein [Endomicrobia bacterium]|nr:cyclic nucleotide-binding domain-containing protein [Endomicrobiia bacterium]
MDKQEFLSQLKIFDGVEKNFLKELFLLTKEKVFEEGEKIFQEGEVSNFLYIIFSGEVEIIKNYGQNSQKLLSVLAHGEIFGEISLFSKSIRTATAIAKTNLKLLEIDSENFKDLFEKYPKDSLRLYQNILLNIMYRLEKTSKELSIIYTVSQIMVHSILNKYDTKKFISLVVEEMKNILPQNFACFFYLYNKFNEEYELVTYCGKEVNWIKTIFENSDEIINKIICNNETQIDDSKVYTFCLGSTKQEIGFVLLITDKNNILELHDKNIIFSVVNFITISIVALNFLHEEKEKQDFDKLKSRYIF